MSCGIYKIENLINKKIYIGKSIDILNRWKEHKTNYKNLAKDCTLYRAIRKYGVDNFSFTVVEECEPINEVLNEREKYWINYYNSFKKGYNDTYGGDGNLKNSYPEIRRLWDRGLSSGEIKKITGCSEKVLNKALKDYSNYGIKEANRRASNAPSASEIKRKASMQTCNSKPVYQYSLEGNYLNEYDCPMAASKALGKGITSHINNVLNGKSKIAFGYLWSYEKKDKIAPYIPKAISVINKETGIIFTSLNKAGIWCGVHGQKIKNACINGNSIETNKGLLTWKFYNKEKL